MADELAEAAAAQWHAAPAPPPPPPFVLAAPAPLGGCREGGAGAGYAAALQMGQMVGMVPGAWAAAGPLPPALVASAGGVV
jgi:hypothetical protein